MPDVPMPPEPEEAKPNEFYQAIWGAGGFVDDQVRRTLTGDTEGRIRRPALFLIAEVGIIAALATDGIVGLVAGGLALVAVLLLAMTDQVTTL